MARISPRSWWASGRSGAKLDDPPQGGLGLGNTLEADQSGGAVDVCPEEVRDQCDGAPGTLQPGFEQTLVVQRAGEIGVRHAVIGLQRDRPLVTVHRFGEPARLPQRVAEVQMRFGQVFQLRQCPFDQRDRRRAVTALIGDHP